MVSIEGDAWSEGIPPKVSLRMVVGLRHITAGRSPKQETIEAKCSGIVCGSNGGYRPQSY